MEQSRQPNQQGVIGPGREPGEASQPKDGTSRPEQSPPRLSATPTYLQELSREYLNIRVLDPLTAYRIKGQDSLQPTAFLADSLLVRGRHPGTIGALEQAADDAGFALEWDPKGPQDDALVERARSAARDLTAADPERAGLLAEQIDALANVWVRRVRLVVPVDPREPVFKPIDTWRLLQAYRVRVAGGEIGRASCRERV